MIYGPDNTVQIVLQAAEQLRRYGTAAPYGTVPPLTPLLIAALTSLTGLSSEQAYAVIVATVWVGGSAAVFAAPRRLGAGVRLAGLGAALFAVAPSRVLSIFHTPDEARLCFGTLTAVLVWLWTDQRLARPLRSILLAATVVALALTIPWPPDGLDALAAFELLIVLTLPRWGRTAQRLTHLRPGGLSLAVFALPSLWLLLAYPTLVHVPQPMPPGVTAWVTETAPDARVYGPPSLEAHAIRNRRFIDRLIRSPGNENLSVRWLRALGVEYFISRDWPKFHSRLECVYEEGEWCVYSVPGANPAEAVLTSRHGWKHLPPLRGPLDIDGLIAYEAWASRPEAVGLERPADGVIVIRGEIGPDDLILVRQPFRKGRRARLAVIGTFDPNDPPPEVRIEADPLGFMVLDPPVTGPVRITLEYRPGFSERLGYLPTPSQPFLEGPFPRIYPGGIGDARTFALPPFRPGAVLSVFGEHFVPGETQVFFGSTPGEVLYVGSQQINVRLPAETPPGDVAVTVEAAGRRSQSRQIEVVE